MKVLSGVFNLDDANVGRKPRVETSSQSLDRVVAGHLHAGDLTERVYSCVGPARTVYGYRVSLEACDCLLEKALYGLPTRLPLPAYIAGSVIAQRDLQRTSHREFSSRFRVPGSGFEFLVQLEFSLPRSCSPNPEPEQGTRNLEPGTWNREVFFSFAIPV